MTGNDSDFGRLRLWSRNQLTNYSDSNSSESWNLNRFWFMLVKSESESFGIELEL